MAEHKYKNQVGILDVEKFQYLNIAIVGCGSIGSFVAQALNKLGFEKLILVDPDKVEPHNTCQQLYNSDDIGDSKASSLKLLLDKNTSKNICTFTEKVDANSKFECDVVFVCVDSLVARKSIINSIINTRDLPNSPKLLVDSRMAGLLFNVFTIDLTNVEMVENYVQGLINGKEHEGACTEKGIIQNVFAIVGVAVEQFKKVLKNEPYKHTLIGNWETYEVW